MWTRTLKGGQMWSGPGLNWVYEVRIDETGLRRWLLNDMTSPPAPCSLLQSATPWTTSYSSGTRREPCRWLTAWRYLSSYWKRRRTCATAPNTTTQVSETRQTQNQFHTTMKRFYCIDRLETLSLKAAMITTSWTVRQSDRWTRRETKPTLQFWQLVHFHFSPASMFIYLYIFHICCLFSSICCS